MVQVLLKLTSRELREQLQIQEPKDRELEDDIRALRAKMHNVAQWTEDEVRASTRCRKAAAHSGDRRMIRIARRAKGSHRASKIYAVTRACRVALWCHRASVRRWDVIELRSGEAGGRERTAGDGGGRCAGG